MDKDTLEALCHVFKIDGKPRLEKPYNSYDYNYHLFDDNREYLIDIEDIYDYRNEYGYESFEDISYCDLKYIAWLVKERG